MRTKRIKAFLIAIIIMIESIVVGYVPVHAQILSNNIEETGVMFANTYSQDSGRLVITKVIRGDVLKEEVENSIVFGITRNETGETLTYALGDFSYDEIIDGYTLELELAEAEYTIEEKQYDIDGKSVNVSYEINNGGLNEGDSAVVTVTAGQTTQINFENDYAVTIVHSGTDGDLDWNINAEGLLTISGNGDYSIGEWQDYSDEITSAEVSVKDITSMREMFISCKNLESVDFCESDTSSVTDMTSVFEDCTNLKSVDVSDFNTEKVINMSWMFAYCPNLEGVDVSGFETQNVKNMHAMFLGCEKLKELNVSRFNTANVTNMAWMFGECYNLSSLDVSNFETSNVTAFYCMFSDCKSLQSLDVSGFKAVQNAEASNMFANCNNLTNLKIKGFDTSNITNMKAMFMNCFLLTELDLSSFHTEQVTDMSQMFEGCSNLKSVNLSSFDIRQVENMSYMFSECSDLETLDVSGFDTSQVTDMYMMLNACSALNTIYAPKNQSVCSMLLPTGEYDWIYEKTSKTVTEITEAGTYIRSDVYKAVVSEPDATPEKTGTTIKSDDLTSDTGKIPEDSSFTVISNDPEKPTVAFDGVEDENAPAVEIPKSIVYNGVTYEVTTVSITDYTSKTDNAKYEVTGNQVDDLTIEYKEPADKKKASAVIPEYSTYKGIKFKVTSVAAKAFKGNKKLKNISIATSITTIGKDSFNGCTNLKTVTVGKSLRTIGNNAFKNCKKLTKVDIKSKRLETIGSGAFYKCSALTNLTFNSTKLKSIGSNAFKSCKKLTKIVIKSKKLKTVGKNALKGVNKKCVIKVPKAKVKAYTKLFAKKGQAKTVKVTK